MARRLSYAKTAADMHLSLILAIPAAKAGRYILHAFVETLEGCSKISWAFHCEFCS
ncbi:MAG: hypothetical protein P8164_00295 [Gammaproteobacteria bacterium]